MTRSFRWQDPGQEQLAERLRSGQPVSLAITSHATDLAGLDVVLALWWKALWELGPGVLPLAFHAFKGGHEEAAATLLLNHATRNIFSLDATYLNDALTALAIIDREVPRQIEPQLQRIAATLRDGGKASVTVAYGQLTDLVTRISPRRLRPAHHNHTKRLALIQSRLSYPGRPAPGLTTHQAKGGEWEAVGVRLTPEERNTLAAGLNVGRDTDRKLYVACTRAHPTNNRGTLTPQVRAALLGQRASTGKSAFAPTSANRAEPDMAARGSPMTRPTSGMRVRFGQPTDST